MADMKGLEALRWVSLSTMFVGVVLLIASLGILIWQLIAHF